MPVLLPSPKYSLVSKRPSPFASRSATTPPFFSLPLCSAIYKSPLGATTACRALPTPSAAARAQKPAGRVSPPLSISQESASCKQRGARQTTRSSCQQSNNPVFGKHFPLPGNLKYDEGSLIFPRRRRGCLQKRRSSSALDLCCALSPTSWSAANRSTAGGIYTADQAHRGEALYKAQCTSCHGDALDGTGPYPRSLEMISCPNTRASLRSMSTT